MNDSKDVTTKCPECGSEYFESEDMLGEGSRVCSHCGQEWWTDIDYTKNKEVKNDN